MLLIGILVILLIFFLFAHTTPLGAHAPRSAFSLVALIIVVLILAELV